MKKQTFEEKFPELIGRQQYTEYAGDIDYTKEDVERCCLSKQRTLKAIEYARNYCYGKPSKLKEILIKELGLEQQQKQRYKK